MYISLPFLSSLITVCLSPQVSKPEDWDQMPVPRKVFVVFFGTREMLVSSTLPPVTLHIPLSARYYYHHHYSYLR